MGWFSDIKNNSLYAAVGKVKNNILTSKEINNNIHITISKSTYHTITFLYTTITDPSNNLTAKHQQTWDLSDLQFKNIKYVKVVYREISNNIYLLEQLLKSIPKVHFTIDEHEVWFTYPPYMNLEYNGNNNNNLDFKITYSGNFNDFVVRNMKYTVIKLSQFGEIDSETTLLMT